MVAKRVFYPGLLSVGIFALILGILLGRFSYQKQKYSSDSEELRLENISSVKQLQQKLLTAIDADNIGRYLRNLTLKPHIAGSPEDEVELVGYIHDRFVEFGFDHVDLISYNVLLSYPDRDKPNQVSILNEDGFAVFTADGRQKKIWSDEEASPLVYPNFNAYSATGHVQGDPVYVNWGRDEDFEYLESQLGISVRGKIVIARYGKIFRANIVKSAEDRGALGVILYDDPKDFAPESEGGRHFVYPKSTWAPGSAAPYGTTLLAQNGDPLTPSYPAVDSAFRLDESQAAIPHIVVQPVSYNDVERIFREIDPSTPAPKDWVGGLDASYSVGPGFKNREWKLEMNIRTRNQMKKTFNVIATIDGQVEADRYVILGNHRDAWAMGAIDPSSGTAVHLELARVIGQMKSEGWRPRRSLVFCNWGAEEYGLIGSMEWVEEFFHTLSSRAVAYINVDLAVEGNQTFRALGVPMLYSLLHNVTKLVDNPNPSEVEQGRRTVFDTWLHNMPSEYDNTLPRLVNNPNPSEVALGRKTVFDTWLHNMPSDYGKNTPRVKNVGSGSDYRGFLHNVGIPSTDVRYFTEYKEVTGYPLYHTLYETYHMVANLLDRGFLHHKAVAQVWGLLAISLSENILIPFDARDYAEFFQRSSHQLKLKYGDMMKKQNITFNYFNEAIHSFSDAALALHQRLIPDLNLDTPYAVRDINDRLMMLERVFINPTGLPLRDEYNQYNHVVFAPSSKNAYSGESFSGLTDLLVDVDSLPTESQQRNDLNWGREVSRKKESREERWNLIRKHFAELTFRINCAATILAGSLHRLV